MSHSAIDQILPSVASTRPAIEAPRPVSSERPAFQEHLERAAKEVEPREAEVEIDQDELTTVASQQDAAEPQQEETSAPADSEESVVTQPEEETDSSKDGGQDEVILSDSALLLVETNTATENGESVQPEPSSAGKVTTEETPSRPPIAAEGEPSGEEESAEPSPALLSIQGKPTSNEQTKQDGGNGEPTDKPSLDTETQAKVDSKAPSEPTEERAPEVRGKSESEEQSVPSAQEKSLTPEGPEAELSKPAAVETETHASPESQKPTPRDSNLAQPDTKIEAPTLQGEQTTLATTASVAAPETIPDTTPLPINPNAEDAIAALRPASTPSTSPVEARTETEAPPTINRARFVQRVGGAIRSAQQRDGQIQLQLSPPELGSLRIEISVKQGVVIAQLEAETSAARTLLLDNLPALRQRLEEQDIRIEKFDVDVRREGGQQNDNPGTQDRGANRSPANAARVPRTGRQQAPPLVTAGNLESTPTLDGGLDVRI